jgi:hypothetical protein
MVFRDSVASGRVYRVPEPLPLLCHRVATLSGAQVRGLRANGCAGGAAAALCRGRGPLVAEKPGRRFVERVERIDAT